MRQLDVYFKIDQPVDIQELGQNVFFPPGSATTSVPKNAEVMRFNVVCCGFPRTSA